METKLEDIERFSSFFDHRSGGGGGERTPLPPAVVNTASGGGDVDEVGYLPPGFRFHPTDEEIIVHYLKKKVIDNSFTSFAIGEVDLNKCEPWDLPRKAKMMGKKEWFFFWRKDRKYPTGTRTNRATASGYWKATGKDKEIFRSGSDSASDSGGLIGMKKTLVFYKGRAPKGQKTNWIMHEFRLHHTNNSSNNHFYHTSSKEEWVVCRVFNKNNNATMMTQSPLHHDVSNSFSDHLLQTPPPELPQLVDFPANSDDKKPKTNETVSRETGASANVVASSAVHTVDDATTALDCPYDDFMADLDSYCRSFLNYQ